MSNSLSDALHQPRIMLAHPRTCPAVSCRKYGIFYPKPSQSIKMGQYGYGTDDRSGTGRLVGRFVAFAYEGILTGRLEGVREVVWPLSVRLV